MTTTSIGVTTDMAGAIAVLFNIAKPHMCPDDREWFSDVGEYVENALQNIETAAKVFALHSAESCQLDQRIMSDLFFFLSDSVKSVRALLTVAAATGE
jgi:hypothetical protein